MRGRSGGRAIMRYRIETALSLALCTCHLSPLTCHLTAEAAVSEGGSRRLASSATGQGGGSTSSSRFRQQSSVGESITSARVSSARFQVVPGFLGASFSSPRVAPVAALDVRVLYAKTAPLGAGILPKTWQPDRDPIFIWEPPPTGPDVAGYSLAVDGVPDAQIDTTATSFDVSTETPNTWSDGVHTFAVAAINSAGNSGAPLTVELWVDSQPPQVTSSSPAAAALFNTASTPITATVADGGSGAEASTLQVFLNGRTVGFQFDAATGTLTADAPGWREGTNSVELRAADRVGNAQIPQVWSATLDTRAPSGSVTINGGASMTTSAYVTLTLEATDSTSAVARLLVSNDRLSGYVEEPYTTLRERWMLTPVRGVQTVYVTFADRAGNVSEPVSDAIELGLLAPETVITTGPAGFVQDHAATLTFRCPEEGCLFAYAFDTDAWSPWSAGASAAMSGLAFGNHSFRVKAAKEANGIEGIQPDEEDPSPAERVWVVGVEPSHLTIPKGPPIKLWRLE